MAGPRLINRADEFDVAAPGVDTDILSADITPNEMYFTMRITVTLAVESIFNITETRGGVTNTYGLNGSTALTAGDEFTFTRGCSPSSSYNFQVEIDGIIERLQVDIIQGGVV